MALRTRPFKFTLWKVANAQNRSCRANIQRHIAFEECDKRQKVPVRFEDVLGKSSLARSESVGAEGTRSGDWFALQKDVASRALAMFIEEQNSLELRLCLGENRTISRCKTGKNAVEVCSSSALPENYVQPCGGEMASSACERLFGPYIETADDILVGSESKPQVTSSKELVDPHLAAQFFSYNKLFRHTWESMEGMLSEINGKLIEESKPARAKNSPDQHSLMESGVESCPNRVLDISSQLAVHMDFCLNKCFSLEEPPKESNEFINALLNSQNLSLNSPDVPKNAPGILYFADDTDTRTPTPKESDKSKKPTLDQLRIMQDYLADSLPNIFIRRHEYRIYSRDVIFENNFLEPSKTTIGISPYAMQVVKLRLAAHFQYANVRLHLLKATTHEDEGCIRISWRLAGIPQFRAFMFWKFLPWNYKDSKSKESEWLEGISTFYLGGDGRVFKHQMDRVLQDKEPATKEEMAKMPGLAV